MPTYYVIGAGGSDSNDGSNDTTQGWATIGKAAATVAAGDTVYVKATGTYTEDVTFSTIGAQNSLIHFIGYSSTTTDRGKVTWTAATTSCMTSSIAYYAFENFIFTGCAGAGVNNTAADYWTWVNCEFNSNGADGISADNQQIFINCVAHSNTGNGIDCDSGILAGCVIYGNATQQVKMDAATVLYKNVVYGTAGEALYAISCSVAIGNTIDCEGGASSKGLVLATASGAVFVADNVLYDCNLGVDYAAAYFDNTWVACNNLVNSNTTDYEITAPFIGINDVTSAPAFTDEAGDDYTLGASSPAIDAGLMPGGIT